MHALAVAALAAATPAHAQGDYPNKMIRMIVGFAAGGGNDIFARLVAQKLAERTGWTVIIENKPGAGGRLAAEYAAKEAPDGYTILVGASGAMAIGPIIYKTGYDTLKSFEPVTMIADFPLILVDASGPSGQDREGAGRVDQGQSRQVELLDLVAGLHAADRAVQAAHRRARASAIPYKSSGEMLLGVVSGNAAMAIIDPPPTTAQVQGRQAARARGDRREAHARTARCADDGGSRRARCGGRIVERLLRSGRHAEADHRRSSRRNCAR